jgi:two-component system, OmpR family, response regulator
MASKTDATSNSVPRSGNARLGSSRMRCLLIEHDPEASRQISRALQGALYAVTVCTNGLDGLRYIADESWDLLILERRLPAGIDGLTVVRRLRKLGKTTPVIVVSSLSSPSERVRGLRDGADDYLPKPFAVSELLARVEALRRRHELKNNSPLLRVADLTLDMRRFRVTRGTSPIVLQPLEFRLLAFLMRHEGQVVTRPMLLDGVWGSRFAAANDMIDAQISRLRSKVDRGFSPRLIHTVRGVGYILSHPSNR